MMEPPGEDDHPRWWQWLTRWRPWNFWHVGYCPGPEIAILWLGVFMVTWNVNSPTGNRQVEVSWHRD